METISFKLQEDILVKVDRVFKSLNFTNRTEFIRECIREKLNSVEKDIVMQELLAFKGSAKTAVSDKKMHQIREEIAQEYAKKFGIKLD